MPWIERARTGTKKRNGPEAVVAMPRALRVGAGTPYVRYRIGEGCVSERGRAGD